MIEPIELTVLFDDDCGFCRQCALVLRRLDGRGRIDFVPLQAAATWLPGAPPQSALLASMHALTADGAWVRGAEAWIRIASIVPLLRPLAFVARLPLVRPLADSIYALVAANRHRVSRLLGTSCRVPPGRT
jgi:predicted DCC family thiol-disulfide oxidoreductase YuxK